MHADLQRLVIAWHNCQLLLIRRVYSFQGDPLRLCRTVDEGEIDIIVQGLAIVPAHVRGTGTIGGLNFLVGLIRVEIGGADGVEPFGLGSGGANRDIATEPGFIESNGRGDIAAGADPELAICPRHAAVHGRKQAFDVGLVLPGDQRAVTSESLFCPARD